MSVICEEVFDEISHPSEEEVRDYATKIGIDPDSEPQLLPLAAEGLMKALPPGWKPCYDDKSKSYYYYNNLTKKTQWEHPLDDVYRGLVVKARTESQSASLQENKEDMTYVTDDILSMDEPPSSKKLELHLLGARKKDVRLSPIKLSPSASPKRELKLFKQRSEDFAIGTKKLSLGFSSFDNDKDVNFDKDVHFEKHPRGMEKTEFKLTGGGSMFLKSNTKKVTEGTIATAETEASQDLLQPRSILREKTALEHSKSLEFDKLSPLDKSEKDEDKKSVRFNLDTDGGVTFSDKSSSEEEIMTSDRKVDDIINIKLTPNKGRFTVSPVPEPPKLSKPDFVKPKLTISKGSDSEEETRSLEKAGVDNLFDSDSSLSERDLLRLSRRLEDKAEKRVTELKQTIWEEKSEELMKFKSDLKRSHKEELNRILENEKGEHKNELDNLRKDLEETNHTTIESLRIELRENVEKLKDELEKSFKSEEEMLRQQYETKKDELEKYYEEKLADTEKELAERVDKSKEELTFNHNATVDQLKQNHAIIIEELKREFKVEEQILRKDHQAQMTELKSKMQNELEQEKNKTVCDEKTYEKLRCEKRLLEDKYRCLKEKYFRLKSEVKLSIEKRNKRKEQTATTNTTGSETEQSNSNNKDRISATSPPLKILEKPPTPKHMRASIQEGAKLKQAEIKNVKQVIIQDIDTSVSDNCYQSDDKANQNDSSDSTNPGRSRKKIFSRLKSSSTSRLNNNSKTRKPQRSCSPVENLRRQLQKLEDLEDQFPENTQSDTYHLRYPFSDGQRFEGSSELEFFRHRIHLERDSIKRAKESLRSQKTLFQQRQKELKLKHGTMARHTLQQLVQEEKELTDMEVNLHRTRSLLGEKVIRLRHLEQSLQRANVQNDPKADDATLSDISSHSASSGISSTEFATGDNFTRIGLGNEKFQESSEIIQSLENLNSEIKEIWDVLRIQHQHSSIAQVIPSLVYPDLGWPILAGAVAAMPQAPPSIPTLADRLQNYRQHVLLSNAQSTVVTHAANQGATTTLVERTRNLRHWLRQTGDAAGENSTPQTTL